MRILTLDEIATALRVNPVTIRRAVLRGDFPPPLPGFRRLRWSALAIEEWMRSSHPTQVSSHRGRQTRGQ